jgi:hypothetical protein
LQCTVCCRTFFGIQCNNISTAAVFLDFGKAFDTTWHPGLSKLPTLKFSICVISLISSFIWNVNLKLSWKAQAVVPNFPFWPPPCTSFI